MPYVSRGMVHQLHGARKLMMRDEQWSQVDAEFHRISCLRYLNNIIINKRIKEVVRRLIS